MSEHISVKEKCGEIFCKQSIFVILCTECQEEYFKFEEFTEHFNKVHTQKPGVKETSLIIKDEVKEADSCSIKQEASLESYSKPFDSITYEQPSSVPSSYNNDDISLDTDELQETLAADSSKELNVKHKKSDKRKKLGPELRKTHGCEQCDKRFVWPSQLQQHIHKKHSFEKKLKCNQCDENFVEERLLKKHMRVAHQRFNCTTCERSYKSAASLREHVLIHCDTSDFVCDMENCGKSFKSLMKLRRHQHIHAADLKHVCEICGYRTRQMHVLVVHLRTHTGERPFPCKICGKYFISSSMVREHQATHALQRNHECEVCGATFTRPKALYHHKHLHLSIKKFVCRICDKAYSQAAGLSAHMRQHKFDGKIM